jgi:hypothetical protein
MKTAKFVKELTVVDPDTNNDVQISVYKHENGGMLAMDSSWLDQSIDEDCNVVIRDPFESKGKVMLIARGFLFICNIYNFSTYNSI